MIAECDINQGLVQPRSFIFISMETCLVKLNVTSIPQYPVINVNTKNIFKKNVYDNKKSTKIYENVIIIIHVDE